jgi:hypothetical protein
MTTASGGYHPWSAGVVATGSIWIWMIAIVPRSATQGLINIPLSVRFGRALHAHCPRNALPT